MTLDPVCRNIILVLCVPYPCIFHDCMLNIFFFSRSNLLVCLFPRYLSVVSSALWVLLLYTLKLLPSLLLACWYFLPPVPVYAVHVTSVNVKHFTFKCCLTRHWLCDNEQCHNFPTFFRNKTTVGLDNHAVTVSCVCRFIPCYHFTCFNEAL